MIRFLALLFLGTSLIHAQTGSPEIQKRLDSLKQSYDAAVQRQIAPSHESALKALNAKYTAALDRFITTSTQAGKLEDAIALRDEKKRITTTLPLPETDDDAPEVLRPLRSTYHQQLSTLETSRDKAQAPLKKRYEEELTKLQTETTKAGKLEDALAVKSVLDGLNPQAESNSVADISGEKPVVAKGNGKTDSKAAQAICEWALANKTVVETSVGSVGINDQLRKAPKGSYKVMGICIMEPVTEFPWELLGGLSELATLKFKFVTPQDPDNFKSLSSLQHLNELHFHDPLKPMALTVEQAKRLPALPTLTHLQFTAGGQLTEVMPLLIQRFPSIRTLQIYGIEDHEMVNAMSLLSGWPLVTDLQLQCNLSVEASLHIAKLPNLRKVMFYTGSYRLDPKSFLALKSIEDLQLNGRTDSSELFSSISKLNGLKRLWVAMENQMPESMKDLSALKSLRSLTLVKMPQGLDLAARQITEQLDLDELGFITGDFSDAGAETISAMKRLRSLNLTGTLITDSGLMALSKIKALNEIALTGTQVSEEGIKAFSKARPRCKIIR